MAKRKASDHSAPLARAYKRPPLKESPAPVVSLTLTCGAGIRCSSLGPNATHPFAPSLATTQRPEICWSAWAAATGSSSPVRPRASSSLGKNTLTSGKICATSSRLSWVHPPGSQSQSKRVQPPSARTRSRSRRVGSPRRDGRLKYPHPPHQHVHLLEVFPRYLGQVGPLSGVWTAPALEAYYPDTGLASLSSMLSNRHARYRAKACS